MKTIYRSIVEEIGRACEHADMTGRTIERIELTKAEMRELEREMSVFNVFPPVEYVCGVLVVEVK